MARWARRIIIASAVLLAGFAGILACANRNAGVPFYSGATFPAALAGAAFLVVAARKFAPARQVLVVFILAHAVLIEGILQVAAWCGVLPGVAAKDRCAFGRVYWATEGRGNSIRNRQGWYAPAFDLAEPRRVAVVGDSLVEAVEVHRTRNAAALLDRSLAGISVIGLGTHGTSPAHHLEVLDYAARHHAPGEVVLVLSIGSDIAESMPELNRLPPSEFLYYQLDDAGRAVLHPQSAGVRQRFRSSIEFPHRSLLVQAPTIIRTHCMTLQALRSARSAIEIRQRLQHRGSDQRAVIGEMEREDLARTGFDPTPFAIRPVPEVERAFAILAAELRLAQQVCAAHGILLRLVSVPHFPSVFYRTQRGNEWDARIGAYDYLHPERALAEFARAEGIPFLAIGAAMKAARLDVEAICSLYFLDGTAHLTERGHAYLAEQIARTFYSAP